MTEQPNPVWLLPVELVALVGCALAPWLLPVSVPMVLPLLGVASLSMAVRRGTLMVEPGAGSGSGEAIAIGAASGLLALALAVLLATPLLEGAGAAVQWSMFPAVRGSGGQLFTAAVLVAALAVAQEAIFRRWIIERAYQLGASGSGAIAIAAATEALVGPGPAGARLGMALFGVALGMLYWRGGRRLGPPLAARLAFGLGALVLQSLQWID